MTGRVWVAVAITAALIAAAGGYGYSRPGATATLLSRHSEPAIHMPNRQVAITAQGKLFHDPSCRYLHGKPEMVNAQEAVRRGYTPCPRCLRQALRP
ncbi:MAG TPA: hypothetical protein VJN48_08595 [Terriglobales bacterium]|nr:hypothetical protein [Terriglobales bacterium]